MNNLNKKCDTCNKPLEPSQFASRIQEGMPAVKSTENLVCRNYPICPKAEKEINK